MVGLALKKLSFVMCHWIPCISLLTVYLFQASPAVPELLARHSANPFRSANTNLDLKWEASFLHVSKWLKQPIEDCLKHFSQQQLAKLK